jgi:hypothetical protein
MELPLPQYLLSLLGLLGPEAAGDNDRGESKVTSLGGNIAKLAADAFHARDKADLRECLIIVAEKFDGIPSPEMKSDAQTAEGLQLVVDAPQRLWAPQAVDLLGETAVAKADKGVRELCRVARMIIMTVPAIQKDLPTVPSNEAPPSLAHSDWPISMRRLWVELRLALAAVIVMHEAIATQTRLEPWLALALAEQSLTAPQQILQALGTLSPIVLEEYTKRRVEYEKQVAAMRAAAAASPDPVFYPFGDD